jgi:hypothetical protein
MRGVSGHGERKAQPRSEEWGRANERAQRYRSADAIGELARQDARRGAEAETERACPEAREPAVLRCALPQLPGARGAERRFEGGHRRRLGA